MLSLYNIYYLLIFLNIYLAYNSLNITFSFGNKHTTRKVQTKPALARNRSYLYSAINRMITDNAFFSWLLNNKSSVKTYQKTVINSPDIAVNINTNEYHALEIFKQVKKNSYSRVI